MNARTRSSAAHAAVAAMIPTNEMTIGLAMTSPRKPRIRNVIISLAAGLVIFDLLATYFGPLRDRFTQGDNGHFLGIAINTEGRKTVWPFLWNSATSSWAHYLFGQGIGSAATASVTNFGPMFPQPHNDYLRLVYDGGLFSLLLFVGAAVAIMVRAYRASRHEDRPEIAAAHIVAFLSLGVVLIMMVTDNPLVYPFCMYFVAVFVGLSLANTARPRQAVTMQSPNIVSID